MTFVEIQALSEYPNPDVFYRALSERHRIERIDRMLDLAQAVRAAGAVKNSYVGWVNGLLHERRRSVEEHGTTVFDRLKRNRSETVFSMMKREKRRGS